MELINDTPIPAALIPSAQPGDVMKVLFICAVTHRIDPDRLRVTRKQRPLLLDPPRVTPNDRAFVRACVSVCATGAVYPPGGEAKQASASLTVGDRHIQIVAFGPRVWREGAAGALAATAPLPFSAMPMVWENAYGGKVNRPNSLIDYQGRKAILPAHQVGHAANLEGKGFYVERGQAINQPLPCLEHPDQLITSWDQRPDPVCFAPYPLWGALRAAFVPEDVRRALVERRGASHVPLLSLDERLPQKLRDEALSFPLEDASLARLESRAAPRTTFDTIDAGTRIRLEGMRPRGDTLAFPVEPPPAALRVRVGDREEKPALKLDAIDIDAEAREVRFVYRTMFSYPALREELRRATLEPTADFPRDPAD